MAANSQKMSLTSPQWLSHHVSRYCLAQSTDTNLQFRESKSMEGLSHTEKKKGLFGLYTASKATGTHGEYTPAQMFTAAPTKRKCKL